MRKKYTRQYIQFNDLVFSGVEVLTADDYSVSFKRNTSEYTHRHGDYNPHKRKTLLAESYTFSMTIKLAMKTLRCEYRDFYRQFAVSELAKVGRLWAVQGGELMWAWAELDKFGEAESKADTLELDVDVYIPEGIWHKADKQRTFLLPWDACDFMECYDFKTLQPCVGEDIGCCDCAEEIDAVCCCDCGNLERDMALCYHLDALRNAYTCNGISYRIVYDCEAAERLFNTSTHYLGQKLCSSSGLIGGKIYADTDLPTSYVKIRISGHAVNPRIEINGNTNIIEGEYDNLTIYPDGTVMYGCDCAEADVGAWVIPEGSSYGWELNPGYNRVLIDLNNCCGTVCAYFEFDPITL